MSPCGRPLDKDVRACIVLLLWQQDISIEAIATRTGTARSTVLAVNDHDHIRDYNGHRLLNYTVKAKGKEA